MIFTGQRTSQFRENNNFFWQHNADVWIEHSPMETACFCSLSKQLFNSEKHHSELQKILNEHAALYPAVFNSWTIEGLSLHEHLQKMKAPGAWGSQLEITAAATLLRPSMLFQIP